LASTNKNVIHSSKNTRMDLSLDIRGAVCHAAGRRMKKLLIIATCGFCFAFPSIAYASTVQSDVVGSGLEKDTSSVLPQSPTREDGSSDTSSKASTVDSQVQDASSDMVKSDASSSQAVADESNSTITPSESNSVITPSLASQDGWSYSGSNTYYYAAGSLVTGSRYIDGYWYRFDLQDGHMLVGSQYFDGHWYRYDIATGRLCFGFTQIEGHMYYYDLVQGYMLTGSQCIDGKWYRYDLVQGYMLTGSQCIDGKWYRYDLTQGYMLMGSQCIDGEWYRYDLTQGYMLMGSQYIDGHWYYYDPYAGYMHRGSTNIDGRWYWYDLNDGYMLTGSQSIYGHLYWYDLDAGYMHTGLTYIYGHWYWYDLNCGFMLFGWLNLYGHSCHFDESTGALDYADIGIYSYSLESAIQAELKQNSKVNSDGSYVKYSDLAYYMNPGNFSTASTGLYQFMLLDGGYSGTSAEEIDSFIERYDPYSQSSLKGLGSAIVEASKKTGLNEVYILSHAILESGWGSSALALGQVQGYKGYYNFFGIGAYDIDPDNGGAALAKEDGWTSPSAAIIGGATWIAQNYIKETTLCNLGDGRTTTQNTLYKMAFCPGFDKLGNLSVWHQYATGITWQGSISDLMNQFYTYSGSLCNAGFEIPLYQQS